MTTSVPVVVDEGSLASAASAVLDAILDEFELRWDRRGERPRAEEFVDRIENEEDAVALIFHEYTLRRLGGEVVEVDEFLARFPRYGARLRRMLALDDAIGVGLPGSERWLGDAPFPEAGSRTGPYRLKRVLGEGLFALVFLAEQEDLAGRPVVIKLSRRETSEPELLARLRHPHVVDILSQGMTEDGRFQRICMPYLGGDTLARILAQGGRPKDGADLLARLDRLTSDAEPPHPSTPARRVLSRLPRSKAVSWIVARLAEGLEAAHRRGIIHGDIKPSNVLLAADGRPLLFDFNLSTELAVGDDERGGTLRYLAPERLRLYTISESSQAVSTTTSGLLDRRRADLYALGLLLIEMLSGGLPVEESYRADASTSERAGVLALGRGDSRVIRRWIAAAGAPAALRDVLMRCLAPDPADRYLRAAHLAEDLDRYVDERPLVHARPTGLLRRALLAVGRQRRTVAFGLLGCGLIGLVGWFSTERIVSARREQSLARLTNFWSGRDPGVFRFGWSGRWQRIEPRDSIAVAGRVLERFDVLGPTDWRQRDEVAALPDHEKADLELWLLEHVWRLANALAAGEDPADLRRALAALEHDPDWAELGPIREQRSALRSRLGMPAGSASTAGPASAREAYLRGLTLEHDEARRAMGEFIRAGIHLRDSFWAHYRAASTAYRIGLYREARTHMERCLAQYPENAAIQAQYAACLYQLADLDGAERACNVALRYDPDLAEVYRTRALIHARRLQMQSAAADRAKYAEIVGRMGRVTAQELTFLISLLEDPSSAWLVQGEELFHAFRSDLADEAELLVVEGLHLENSAEPLRMMKGFLDQGLGDPFVVAHDDVLEQAIELFGKAVDQNPDHLVARLRMGWLTYQTKRYARGMRELTQLIEHPRFEELVAQDPDAIRCVEFAQLIELRNGRVAQAIARLKWGLGLTARIEDIETRQRLQASLQYSLARAHAQRAKHDSRSFLSAKLALEEAARLEPQLFNQWYRKDPAFDSIRERLRIADAGKSH